jgi:transcriptional regulator with XRE-family HTH domain
MSAILELSAAVRTRRSDMGLTQTTLAKLSGLSRATVNQVENGTIHDLSLTRAAKLLGNLGLSLTVAAPRPKNLPPTRAKSSALDIAARTASVSYRDSVTADQLREVFTTDGLSADFLPHLYTLLEEAPVSLLASVVEELHVEAGVERAQVWKRMRELARRLKSSRELWL